MHMRSLGLALAAIVCLGLPSQAATVQSVQGKVSINRGGGFQPVAASAQAGPGDVVTASPGGSAQVVYGDGCKVTVNPGAVVMIQELSPCVANAYAQVDDQPSLVSAGLAVAGGVTGVILLATENDDDKRFTFTPASP